ncbi:MAG: hypothetical protein JWN79_1091 [Gemmatimonadetes bacterium]|nr:hypothetical protein [Gemmatimonadota bacterium]
MSDSNAGGPVYVIAAAGCVATSALLVWAAVTHAPGLRVPSAVALVLAGATGVAAWRVGQLYRGGAGTGDGSAALVLAAMAVFGLWVAVGGGARQCGVRLGSGPSVAVAGAACRVPFGIGGLLATVAALYALRRWARARRASTPGAA